MGDTRATMEPMAEVDERRRAPRVEMAVECTLHRRAGSPIPCETVDVGTGGMSVCSERPLATDEVFSFEMAPMDLTGRARVLRQYGHRLYALRFEALPEHARVGLQRLVGRPG